MERSTPAVLAAATVTGAATVAGGFVLATGPALSWSALAAVVLGPAALLCEVVTRLPRVRRARRFPEIEYLQRGLAVGSVAAGLWALSARTDRTATWILGAVLIGAALCVVWFESDPYGLVRQVFVPAGAAAAVGAAGAGAYLLSDSPGVAAATVAFLLVLAAAQLTAGSTATSPLPLEIGWLGPAVAVAVSIPVAGPLAEVVAPAPGFAATVGVGSIVAGLQCVVQFAVLRILRPAVPAGVEAEGEAAAARSAAAAARRNSRGADPRYRPIDSGLMDYAERMRVYGSTKERRVFEEVLSAARESGDYTELHHLLQQYERYSPDTLWDRPRWSPSLRPERILVSPATVAIVLATARTEGVVIDRIWPRIDVVLPPAARRGHAWSDRAVALARSAAASASAAVFALVAASLYTYATVPLVVGSIALLAGRRRVEEVYRQRARSIAVFRMHLVRALHLPEPTTRAELVAMGGILSGDTAADELAVPPEAGRARTDAVNTAQLVSELSATVADELRAGMRTLQHRQEALLPQVASAVTAAPAVDRIAEKLADATSRMLGERLTAAITTLRSQTDESITRAVAAVLAGPPLIAFTGYIAIELEGTQPGVHRGPDGVIHAPPGASIRLAVTVVADENARDVAPDRGATGGHDFVALETVTIDGLKSGALVEFDVLLDSATMTPAPHRRTIELLREKGERSDPVQLELPDSAGVHEAWLQLYQSGRLIQAVAVAVDTRAADRAQRGER